MPRSLLVVVLMLASEPAFAADTATAIGTVLDQSGGALPGASVTARNVDTGIARSGITAVDGRYRLPVLPPGHYEFTAQLPGFATAKRNGVTLTIGSEATVDFQMRLASVSEEVTVKAEAPLVETTNAAVQGLVDRQQLDVLPLISRDYLDLIRLQPGVRGETFTGSRERSNTFLVDGVDNSEDISGFRRQGSNLDGIEEFQVLINNFKAEYGRASGGVVNVLTRSGSNDYHGNGFFTFRNEDLIARDPFLSPGADKDPFTRKQWGGTFGGPIARDRTHFFLTFEHEGLDTFTASTRPFPAAGATISPVTQAFLRQYGVPAFPDTAGLSGTAPRVRLVRPERDRVPSASAKIDHQISSRQSLTLSLNWAREAAVSGSSGTVFDVNGTDTHTRAIYGNLRHKWIRSSSQLNELYLQIGQSKLSFVETNRTLPNIFIDEFSTGTPYLGAPTNRPQGRTDTTYQIIDNYTIHLPRSWLGSHVIKVGGDAKLFRSDSYFDSNFRGSYFFTTVATFLAGRPRRFTQNQGNSQLDRPNSIFALYAQDDWRLGPKLTLNLGLRYDYENGKTEALREVNGVAGPGISGDKNNLSPRFGFVWDPAGDGKTAVHGGAGLYYDQVILNIQGNARFTPPKVVGVQIENPAFPDPYAGGLRTTLRPNISVIDENLVTPYSFNTSLGIKREITRDLAADLTLVRNRGYDHVLIVNTNSIDPVTGVRPDPRYTNVSFYTNLGRITYDGLLLEVRKRMAHNHSWGLSYTLSKNENTAETFVSAIQDPRDPGRSFGASDDDLRHLFRANFVANLPFGLQVGGIFSAYSEDPLNVIVGGRDLNGDGITGDWPAGYSRNSVRELSTAEANRLRALYGLPAIAEYADNPKFWDLDMTVQKSIGLGGSRRLKITAEVFNVFNHPNFANPSASITSSLFGQITSIVDRPRSIQLTGQVDF